MTLYAILEDDRTSRTWIKNQGCTKFYTEQVAAERAAEIFQAENARCVEQTRSAGCRYRIRRATYTVVEMPRELIERTES